MFLSETFNDVFFGCIETVVYFHKATKFEAEKFCNASNTHTKIWTKGDIDYISNIDNKLNAFQHTYALSLIKSKLNNNGLLADLVKELGYVLI